ncbi:DNA-binding transcriptional LysR family regulator [Geomicrobium halophilum]|uniref:DNA-binding transcriptional LysR family regulator n=1 Tax=Geomicrobium halophilum TaxID=549000 RepID=A0A841Q0S7_9BACL|nr:LysR family transcriptional regulator [Geomicrobium halophilum]MBB6451292.1 DNA-binding transcriptional LysR family regulator [Geomicrobium halophilum]
MNLLSFRYFLEVANTLNFSEASKRLHVSQPGLSQQISTLEKEMGFKLLKRTTRQVSLTEEGAYLYENLQPSFNKIENIINDIVQFKQIPQTTVRISSVPSAASLWVPKLLKKMRTTLGPVELYIEETTSKAAIQAVKQQQSHIAFIRTPTDPNELRDLDMMALELSQHPLRAILSKNHRLAGSEAIHLEDLKYESFIHYHPNNSPSLYYLLERACLEAGFVPNTLCVGPELMTIENLIGHEIGVTLMPDDMAGVMTGELVTIVPIAEKDYMSSISLIWEESPYTPFITQDVVNMAKKLFSHYIQD